MFENRLHWAQTKESPGLRVQKKMDYQVRSLLTEDKTQDRETGIRRFWIPHGTLLFSKLGDERVII